MTPKQHRMYWAEWKQARRVLLQRGGYTPTEADCFRDEITVGTLGTLVSSKDLKQRQIDLMIGAFKAISQPDNLNAQIDAMNGVKRRLIMGIEALHAEAYVQDIALDTCGTPRWRELEPSDLLNLRRTLAHRLERRVAK